MFKEKSPIRALDVERNRIIYLRVYPARNALIAYSFLKVLKMCEVEEIILDKGPWYRCCNAWVLNSDTRTLQTFGL